MRRKNSSPRTAATVGNASSRTAIREANGYVAVTSNLSPPGVRHRQPDRTGIPSDRRRSCGEAAWMSRRVSAMRPGALGSASSRDCAVRPRPAAPPVQGIGVPFDKRRNGTCGRARLIVEGPDAVTDLAAVIIHQQGCPRRRRSACPARWISPTASNGITSR